MSEPEFIITSYGDGYIALSNIYGRLTAPTLVGFGARVRDHVRQQGAEPAEVTLHLDDSLRAMFAACATCLGTGLVESNALDGQIVADAFGSIDFMKTRRDVCAECAGLRVDIPKFWNP